MLRFATLHQPINKLAREYVNIKVIYSSNRGTDTIPYLLGQKARENYYSPFGELLMRSARVVKLFFTLRVIISYEVM
jgi:hypothetical protein